MPHDKAVKNLMIPLNKCPTVSPEDTVQCAVVLLKQATANGHQCILVMDKNGQPIGLLSQRILLRTLEPEFVVTERWSLPVFWNGFFTDKCKEEAKKKVKEIMRPINILNIDAKDPIIKAVHIMANNHINLLPVLENGKVSGVLRLSEIFQEIAELLTDSENNFTK